MLNRIGNSGNEIVMKQNSRLQKMIFYITFYAIVIGLGASLCYFGGKGMYYFLRLTAVGVNPLKMLAYGDELVKRYSFACGILGITHEDLTYRAIISISHGACIKLTKKGWILSNMHKLLREIPGSERLKTVFKWMHDFFGNFLELPLKISVTGYPIEKYLWPQNEITIESIKKNQERGLAIPEKLDHYIISSNVQIGDGVTPTRFVVNEITILRDGFKIEVKPKGNLLIREKGLIVYAECLIVKGNNSLEHWRYPSADSLPLVIAKTDIPQDKYNKITALYDILIRLHELTDDLRNKSRSGATTDLVVLKGKFAKLATDAESLAEDLGIGYVKMMLEKDYESALR